VAVEAIALAAAVAILAAGRAETDVDTSYAEAFFPGCCVAQRFSWLTASRK
jgi:hypothetical protein